MPASNKEILARMLRNLKAIHLKQQDLEQSLALINMLLVIQPDSEIEIYDRAVIHQKMGLIKAAVEDYERYLLVCRDIGDAMKAQALISELKNSVSRLH